MYFGHREAREWFARVAELARAASGRRRPASVEFFVIPTYLQIARAIEAFAGHPDDHRRAGCRDRGLRRLHRRGQRGRARRDRRRRRRDRPRRAAPAVRRHRRGRARRRPHAALRNGLPPVLCIGETERRTSRRWPRRARSPSCATPSTAHPPARSSSPTSRSGRSALPSPRPSTHIRDRDARAARRRRRPPRNLRDLRRLRRPRAAHRTRRRRRRALPRPLRARPRRLEAVLDEAAVLALARAEAGRRPAERLEGTTHDRPRHLRVLLAALRPGRRAAVAHRRARGHPRARGRPLPDLRLRAARAA